MNSIDLIFPLSALICAVITSVILRFLIPILKSKKMGQKILDIGPRWHKDKEGTPTMGGLAFITAVFVTSIVFSLIFLRDSDRLWAFMISVIYSVLCGLIGVSDDLCKLRKEQNEGLSASQKYLLQLITSAVFLVALRRFGFIYETVYIPFTKAYIDFNWLFYPFMLLVLSGFNNAVNLTDGIDGLCSSVTASVSAVFFALSIYTENSELGLFSAVIFGAMLGFLVYNLHPAKVFMGDTGSLFLGGAVCSMAILSEKALLIFIVGIIYLIEAISVIIQVFWFKLTGKRFFKMAPIHHHLEKCSWSENKITVISSLITLILGAICFYA